ncbi:hypothetical protein AVEN_77020-1 [Araneus ventricosus]|uniref:Uncharacterized protein n=1 Tax=Araneus ventricosus TaxID=182803 RepID=A0A4Y2PUX5_ARAVE|nr:hypothetical protein AVEN_77020-1 [Araneus ventricosus]
MQRPFYGIRPIIGDGLEEQPLPLLYPTRKHLEINIKSFTEAGALLVQLLFKIELVERRKILAILNSYEYLALNKRSIPFFRILSPEHKSWETIENSFILSYLIKA